MDSKTHDGAIGAAESERLHRYFPLWLAAILAVAGAAYADLAAQDPIFQRAEDYFAEAAREMSALSLHVTPILYGKPFFDKPILSYWAIQASLGLFGITHFAARFPSIVAAVAAVALTAYAAAHRWGRRSGLMAAVTLSTSYVFFYFATLAMADMWLTLFSAAAAVFLFAGSENRDHRLRNWNMAAIFCGLAILSKGPVGVVLPAGALLLYLMIRREIGQVRPRHVLAGLFVIAAVAGPWFAVLWKEQGNSALRAFFMVENLARFTGLKYATHHPFGYIPLTLLADFLPWTIFLPLALLQSVRQWRADWNSRESRGELFAWCYVAVVVGFFWMARTQMDYYVLPAMPACALLTGVYLNRAMRQNASILRFTSWISALGCCLAGAGLFCAALAAKGVWSLPGHAHLSAGFGFFWPLASWVFACGVVGTFLTLRKNYVALMGLTLLGFFGGASIAVHETTLPYEQAYPLPALAQASGKRYAGESAALSGDLEHWRGELSFETRSILLLPETPQDLTAFLSAPEPHVVIITDAWAAQLPSKVSSQGQVIYRTPMLRGGMTLKDLLDRNAVAKTTDGIAVIYFPGTLSTD